MPALKPTEYRARITWLGRVSETGLRSSLLERADLDWTGIVGERHGGLTRPSCSRVVAQHPKGTEIRNVRQLSIVSAEDLAEIARQMELGAVDPSWLGASMVVSGLPDLTNVPPSSRLQAEGGATLVVDMANRPCHLPGREIEREHPGIGARFKAAAAGRRGVTAWVERPGMLSLGSVLRLHVPDQPAWTPQPELPLEGGA
ncbi:MOSC domain-containing protein [Roseivivax sediminis]|uniref:MOSC domain-containing protein YiiM n=1 Tax=Roseivivax sediminis TaxID=936889 RepID=A0A1I1UTH3_9RHOB|nr:MOSC domain-containing protein [Roseivivax sediminis]SFD73994.1 MOSC domain-containing protein YiiM [Roseivivax sediminis]